MGNKNFNQSDWQDWLQTLKNFFHCYKITSIYDNERDFNRPFIDISINSKIFSGLLDSGSSITILGNNSHLEILKLGFTLSKSSSLTITTASNHTSKCLGSIDIPIRYNNQTHLIQAFVFPNISPSIILGVDFWKKFNLVPHILSSAFKPNTKCSVVTETTKQVLPYNHLSLEQKTIADDMIKRFKAISFESRGKLGRTHLISHHIDTGDTPPIKQRCYRLSPVKQKALIVEVDKMLEWGVIEKCESPWLSPVIITPKKNGEWRFCVDSRKLNSVTRRDAYSLPFVNEILDNLKNAKFLSSIDIAKAFWEIPLKDEADKDKTAFYVPGRGMYRFVIMPFGLTNAPATQQRLMDMLFTPEFDNKVFCYLDDIIIISESFEEHISYLVKVLEKLTFAKLTINFDKSQFFKNELKYLGYIVDSNGLRSDPTKIKAILEFPTPTNRKEVRKFIGTCSWFRRFIPNFSTIATPLNKLTSSGKNAPRFFWDKDATLAFNKLKEALVTTPILACPDYDLPFSVHCDASNFGIGGMLTQIKDDKEVVIAYMSKSLNKNERNYSTTERETLAVISALEHWRCYIDNGKQFTVYTDHAALKWFLKLSNPSGRLARWALRLSSFNFILKHKRGRDNLVPDLLSRTSCPLGVNPILLNPQTVSPALEHYNKILLECRNNPDQYPNYTIRENKLFRYTQSPYALTEDFAWKEVPHPDLRETIVKNNHGSPDQPHLGIFKTYKKLSLLYYWPAMFKDIAKIISICDICLTYKHANHSPFGLMGKPKICSRPFQTISLDLMGPLPMTRRRNQFILVVNCCFTKYSLIFPLKRATSANIISNLENFVFLVHGVPQTIIMDNGPQFQSHEFRNFLGRYSIPHIFFSPHYCPQVNPTERYNRTIITALSSLVGDDHRSWDIHLPKVQYVMNSTTNTTTGFSPNFLLFGRETVSTGSLYTPTNSLDEIVFLPRDIYATNIGLLSAIFDKVQIALHIAHARNSSRYNESRSFKEYNVGDTVWRRNYVLSQAGTYFSAKLAPKYVKSTVLQKLSPLVYILEDPNGNQAKWHIKDFKI